MSINFAKLTPLPLEIVRGMEAARNDGTEIRTLPKRRGEYGEVVAFMHGYRADANAFLLGRQALDIMMRRKWSPSYVGEGWSVADVLGDPLFPKWDAGAMVWMEPLFADPFTALVEAEKWYVANVKVPT